VVNKTSAKCVETAEGATRDGSAVQQAVCSGASAQQWRFTALGGGYYEIAAANNAAQGWDVIGGTGATGDAVKLQLRSYAAASNQQWQAVWEPGGTYHLIARHSDKCLDVPSSSVGDGVQLQQYTCNNTGAQSFQVTP
jgi:hypothetical protein